VTICTQDKQHLFGEIFGNLIHLSPIGEIITQCWEEIPKHFHNVNLDEYVIMPNHIHGIIIINEIDICRGEVTSPLRKATLGNIIAYFKYQSTKAINDLEGTPGIKIWQRNYYDRIIRGEKELQNIRDYIANHVLTSSFEMEHPENIPL
jgi:putative transposase